jgi:hypothetical protein
LIGVNFFPELLNPFSAGPSKIKICPCFVRRGVLGWIKLGFWDKFLLRKTIGHAVKSIYLLVNGKNPLCRKKFRQRGQKCTKKGRGTIDPAFRFLRVEIGVEIGVKSLSLTFSFHIKYPLTIARALRIQYPGALFHVTNRGNERSAVFKDDVDRNEFLNILTHSISTFGFILHSFVLKSTI